MPGQRSPALAFAPHLDVTTVDGRGLIVLSPQIDRVFAGAEYALVGGAIDGERSEHDLLQTLNGDPADARRALEDLLAAGVVVERDDSLDAAAAAYWALDRFAPALVAERLAGATVSLASFGEVDDAPVRAALDDAGVGIADEAEHLVVLTDDYLREELRRTNEQALETGNPWLLAAPGRAEPWIGPVFVPDRGACWECLAQRLRRGKTIDRFLRDAAKRDTPIIRDPGSLTTTRQAAAAVIATEVVRWFVAGTASKLAGRVVSLDTRTWQTAVHEVIWRPQCPACGAPDASVDRPAQRIALVAPGSAVATHGDLRTITAEATAERFAHHVSPISGVLPRLARAAGIRPPLHAYLAGDPGPEVHGDALDWAPGATTAAGGKGPTDAQARASALCEALERYSGEFSGDEPRRTGTLADLAPAALHPNSIMGFSDAQYARRDEANAMAQSLRTLVAAPFDAEQAIEWTPLWSLTAETERLLPTAYCYYQAHLPGHLASPADSNGNAAGNTVEEAILQGFLELVERDHVALWWYNRLRLPGVDLDSIDDPWLEQVRARFRDDGRELWTLDLTADLGIPVAAALASGPQGERQVALGFGAHLDLGLATLRAVAELIQIGAYAPSGGLGHGPKEPLDAVEGSYLRPADDIPARIAAHPATGPDDLRIVLDDCRARVEARGLEMMVLDQTRPDIGLPVVKVVVPGMRHFWPRFAPGRLYDVPVELGHLPKPLSERELNPVSPVA